MRGLASCCHIKRRNDAMHQCIARFNALFGPYSFFLSLVHIVRWS